MLRLVIDTNLYIDWLNAGRHEAVLFQRDAVKYLSAVVMMELYAGAFSTRDRRLLRQITTAFRKADRILLPSAGVYEEPAPCCAPCVGVATTWPPLRRW